MDNVKEIFNEILEDHPDLAKFIAEVYDDVGADEFIEILTQAM